MPSNTIKICVAGHFSERSSLLGLFQSDFSCTIVVAGMKDLSKKTRVGILRGGPSGKYEVSLNTGKNIIESLRGQQNYDVQDIYIDRSGIWHVNGVSRAVERILPHIDVAVNALHGAYGEDGRVQQILESHNTPFTGSRSFGSAVAINKPLARKFFKMHGLLTPEHVAIKSEDVTPDWIHKMRIRFPHLKLVKPATASISSGMTLIGDHDEFEEALSRAFEHSHSAVVEERVKGREAICGVVEGENGVYALEPVEIVDGAIVYPGSFNSEEIKMLQKAAVTAHNALDLRHYSRSDFVVNRIGPYILEINTLPALTPTSVFSRILSEAGITMPEFIDHIIALALEKK